MTSIKAEKREIVGKKVKKLRVGGKIPAVMYGAGEKGLLLEISGHDFEKVFKQAGESSLDQVDQLIRQFDVGVLQGTGLQSTQGAAARGSAYRLTRLEGLHPGSFAHRRQALHVGKVGQNHLPLHL